MNRRLAIGIGTAVAVLAAGGGVAALGWPYASPAKWSAGVGVTTILPDSHAAPPRFRAVLASLDIAPRDPGATTLDVPRRATRPFSLLGISWNDPAAQPHGSVQVRTRSAATGAWSPWRVLRRGDGGADPGVDAASGARGATEPTWVGASTGVAARIIPAAGVTSAPLPAGLRLHLVDPGGKGGSGGQGGGEPLPSESPTIPPAEPTGTATTETPGTEPSTTAPETAAPQTTAPPTTAPATTAPATGVTTAPSTATPVPTSSGPQLAPLPPYVSRAGWSADETIVAATSAAPAVQVLFVHHTAGTNDYSCTESAAILRAIQKYHVTVNKWADIGYNFLVDKCGTLFEGRHGGVTNAIIGAHTYGFNTGTAGIALLGDYNTALSSTAAEGTIAQVAAARLGAYGFSPTTTTQLTEGVKDGKFPYGAVVTFQRISGHRDGVATECPGTNLYARLPAIRARSVDTVYGLAAKPLTGGTLAGGVYYVRTSVTLNWTVTTPSAMLARFELLLDGKVTATVEPTLRTGTLAIPADAHTVAIRAVHVSGATATTPAANVIGDTTAPTFPVAPGVVLRTGTYSSTYAPVTVGYRAADNVTVASLAATTPSAVALSPASTAWYTGVRPGLATTFTLVAKDYPGNARTAAVQRKALLVAETSAVRGGTWTTRWGTAYLGGRALAANRAGAKLAYTFTGRSAALIFSRGSLTGQAYVYLDGVRVATVDTRQTTTAYRQGLWVRSVTAAKHTVTVVVVGTSGRPTVVADGLAYVA